MRDMYIIVSVHVYWPFEDSFLSSVYSEDIPFTLTLMLPLSNCYHSLGYQGLGRDS